MPWSDSDAAGEAPGVSVRDSYGFVIGDHTVQINNYGTKTWSYAPAKEPLSDGDRVAGSPYRGLGVYEAGDEDLFFGREAAVAQVLERMARSAAKTGSGLLVVSGVSGAGKSSLLRAGILPQVQRRGLAGLPLAAAWPRLLFTPTGRPLDELAVRVAALARTDAAAVRGGLATNPEGFALTAWQAAEVQLEGTPGGRLLVVIDQFEQLFTQCTDEAQQRAFVGALHAAASGSSPGALVVIGVRADFEAHCADYPELVGPVQDRYLLTAMTEPELRLTITEPARRAGAHVDEGLVEHLLDQVRARRGTGSQGGPAGAGVLPLLSHALDQTWRNHTSDALTIADYRATGGIEAAVATSAQRAYDALPPACQDTARRVFLRLTATTSDGTDTGAQATRRELEEGENPADVQTVLDGFVAERLLTVGAQTVELSHEVLLSAWPLLRDTWLAQTRDDRLVRSRLRETAGEWAAHDRNPSYLYRGFLLASAQAAAEHAREDPRRYPALSSDEAAFVQASIRVSRRRTRQLQGVAALLTVLVLVLAGVTLAIIRADQETASQRDTANRQRDAAVAGQLAAESETMGSTDPVQAKLYALAAWRIDPSLAQARYAMQSAALLPLRYWFGGPSKQLIAFNPRGGTFAINTLAGLFVDSLASGLSVKFMAIPPSASGQVSALAFSPDGRSLAAGTVTDGTYLWDTATGKLISHLQALGAVSSLAFARDGSLAIGTSGDQNGVPVPGVELWAAGQLGSLHLASVAARATSVASVAFSRDGRLLAAGTPTGTLLLDVPTGHRVGVIASGRDTASVAFSPTGTNALATAGAAGAQLWNPASGRRITMVERDAAGESLDSVAFSPDGTTLAVGTGRAIQLWNLATRSQEGTPIATGDTGPNSAVFSPDGTTVATTSATSTLLWSVPAVDGAPAETLPGDGSASWVDYSHVGVLMVSSRYGLRTWNTSTGKATGPPIPLTGGGGPMAFSRDDSVFAAIAGKQVMLTDTATKSARMLSIGGTSATIFSLAVSPDGKLLAIATKSGIELWNVASPSQRPEATFALPGIAQSVAFSPDGTRLAAVNNLLNSLHLWEVPSGRPLRDLSITPASTVAWSPDGKLVALGGISQVDQYPLNPHTNTGLPLSTGKVTAAAWSPDGSVLAVGTAAGTELWNTVTHQQIGALLPSAASVTSLSWSPDGSNLAVGTSGPTQVWDLSALRAADTPADLCTQAGRGETLTTYQWVDIAPGIPYRNVCA